MVSSNVKKISIIAAVVILLTAVAVAGFVFLNKPDKEADSVENEDPFGYQVLKVGGEFVDAKVFEDERRRLYLLVDKQADLMQATQEEIDDRILTTVIDKAVVENYLLNKSGEQVTEAEVDDYINEYIRSRYKTQEEYEAFLTTSDFDGEEELRKVSKIFLLQLKAMPKVAKEYGITVDDKEAEDDYEYFKSYNTVFSFRHIYISNEKRSDQEALELANDIYKQLSEGGDFKDLAAKHSDDEETKNNGGLNEDITLEEINEELKTAYSNAKEGELIPPVKIEKGYDIVKIEKISTYYPSIDSYKDNMLISKFMKSDGYKQWLDKIKAEESIEIVDTTMRAYREFKEGEYLKAGQDYEAAYKEDKKVESLEKAAESYGMMEDWKETVRVCDLGISKHSSVPTFYAYKGVSLYKTGQTKEGLELLKKAESLAEKDFNYLMIIESAYKDLGLNEDAERINKIYYSKD